MVSENDKKENIKKKTMVMENLYLFHYLNSVGFIPFGLDSSDVGFIPFGLDSSDGSFILPAPLNHVEYIIICYLGE